MPKADHSADQAATLRVGTGDAAWFEELRESIDSWNEWLEINGLPLEHLQLF
ncbi:type II toxin-antitoxin system CcdA family antitoxin [Glacieibacterium frigidum]|uniref:hypothetical protein n=1 Tax=Glacieibacterium frigidum TaxID=2593303 RepID=UPI00163D9601|nr:hypothetical protein [Glacieibacterium frigidum]